MIELDKNKKDKKLNTERVDRIPLTISASTVVSNTIDKLIEKHPGISLSKKDFVNWIIEDHFKKLTPTTEKQLFEKFYDEVKFLEKSIKEFKRKKRNGEDISIDSFLKKAKPKFKPSTKQTNKENINNTPPPSLEKSGSIGNTPSKLIEVK